jgi:hypothetical protein
MNFIQKFISYLARITKTKCTDCGYYPWQRGQPLEDINVQKNLQHIK